MVELATHSSALARARVRVQDVDAFWAGTTAVAAVLAGVLAWFLRTWPPHEDEALALFVGRGSLGHVLHTVVTERGGAPLHFFFAWVVVHLGGGLTGLRIVSLVFAVASVPVIALLGARLADRAVGVVAAALASGRWVLFFHGIYGRMYSLFLFTSLLSFLGLLYALDRGGRHRFALWGVALLLMLASHPYAVLVVAAQGLFVVLRRKRLRAALVTLAAVGVAGIPFWWADLVLRDRFDVGVGGGGPELGSPTSVLHYFWWVAGDFSAGHRAWSAPVLVLALVGLILLWRRRAESVVLFACVVAVPALAFMLATLNSTTSPEARHLIFALPFFSVLLALPRGWIWAVGVLGYFVLIHIFEGELVGPRIVGKAIGLHPIVSLAALIAGAELFGIWGALFASPLAGILQAMLVALWQYDKEDLLAGLLLFRLLYYVVPFGLSLSILGGREFWLALRGTPPPPIEPLPSIAPTEVITPSLDAGEGKMP